jgi:hypothetical protein
VAKNNPPRRIDIKGQDHMLAYITPEEGGILQLLGGAGKPGPMGIPSYYGPDGPGDDGSNEASPSGTGTESPSTGGPTGYSGSISNAMAASSPTGIGVGFGRSTNMGIDDDVAAMMGITAGATRGMVGPNITALNKRTMIDPMTGKRSAFNPAVATHTGFFGRKDMANAINAHIGKGMANFGISNSIDITGTPGTGGRDVTGVTGPGGSISMSAMTNPIGLLGMIGNAMGFSTTTGTGGPTDDDDIGLGGDGNINPIQPYQLPTNPYNRNEYRGTELPINTTIPNSPITTDPTVQDPNAERDYNLSQGLNEGYDFAKSPFAGMSINDTQLLTAPKEFSGISSLDPLGAQDVYSNVTNDNMVKSYQDSAKGLDSVGADLRANKGYGM